MSSCIFISMTAINLLGEVDAFTLGNPSNDNIDADNFNKVTTTLSPKDQIPYSFFVHSMIGSIIAITMTYLVVLVADVGNLVVLLAFHLERPLRENYSNYLVVSLAVSDVMLCSFCATQATWNMVLNWWPFGWFYCQFWYVATTALLTITQTNAFLISIDRFLVVKYPIKYRIWRTKRKMLLVISISWTFWTGFALCTLFYWTNDRSPDWSIDRPNCLLRLYKVARLALYFAYFVFRLLITAGIYLYLLNAASNLNRRLASRQNVVVSKGKDMNPNEPSSPERDLNSNQAPWKPEDNCGSGSCRLTAGHGDMRDASRTGRVCLRRNYCNIDNPIPYHKVKMENGNHEINSAGYKDTGFAFTQRTSSYSGGIHPIAPVDVSLINTNNSSKGALCVPSLTTIVSTSVSDMYSWEHREANRSQHELKGVQIDADAHLYIGSSVDKQTPAQSDLDLTTVIGASSKAPTRDMVYQKLDGQRIVKSRMQKAVRTVFFMFTANVFFYGPFAFMTLLSTDFGIEWPSELFYIMLINMYANSAVNPLIYALVNPLFKETFLRIFRCDWHINRSATETKLQRKKQSVQRSTTRD